MTEPDYLAATTRPAVLLAFAAKRVRPRKVQLMAAGFCRLLDPAHLTGCPGRALAALEGYATGRVTEGNFLAARRAVEAAASACAGRVRDPGTPTDWAVLTPADWAAAAVAAAVNIDIHGGARRAARHVIDALGDAVPVRHRKPTADAARSRACDTVREVAGNVFRPWAVAPAFLGGGLVQPDGLTVRLTSSAVALAHAIDAGRHYGDLPVLADALEEAGVTDAALLAHCRRPAGHLPGCWALDVVLGRS